MRPRPRRLSTAAALLLAACASQVPEERAPDPRDLTAEEARLEAGAHAMAWAAEPRLLWVEGEGIGGDGEVASEEGFWRFIYEAPGQPEQLVVTVSPGASAEAFRHKEPPPAPAPPDGAVGLSWIDSDDALAAVSAGSGGAPYRMTLLPTTPPEWRIRIPATSAVLRVDARTGQVIP